MDGKVAVDLVESYINLLPGWWLISPAGWLPGDQALWRTFKYGPLRGAAAFICHTLVKIHYM